MINDEFTRFINLLSRLPGLGPRSGRRIALHLMQHKDQLFSPLLQCAGQVYEHIGECAVCANLDITDPCRICSDGKRNTTQLCIVETVSDLWALERSGVYKGMYHVLGGTLSAIDGIGPAQLNFTALWKRIAMQTVNEVILALSATADGRTTMHYIAQHLPADGVKVTVLAQGVPLGGELDYIDEATLSLAMQTRRNF